MRTPTAILLTGLLGLAFVLPACTAPGGTQGGGTFGRQRPVLYPNAKYDEVGPEVAEMDIAGCMRWAEMTVGDKSVAGEMAKNTLGGAAIGAAAGAVGGAIAGDAGTGAAIGAGTGGTLGAARGVMKSKERDPTFQGYVERCLRERGYDVVGWR